MKHTARKISARIQNGRPEIFHQLVQAVRDVQRHRQITAAEPPETQDAWDRLRVTALEAERILQSPLPRKRPLPGALRSK